MRGLLEAIEVPLYEITPVGENQMTARINQATSTGEGVEVALWPYIRVSKFSSNFHTYYKKNLIVNETHSGKHGSPTLIHTKRLLTKTH